MLRVALIALVHRVAGTTVNLSQDWAVAIDANAKSTLDVVVEEDILAYSLVHGGKIIAEYYRDGRDASVRKRCADSTRSRSYTLWNPPMATPPPKRPSRPPCRALVVAPGIRHRRLVLNPAVGTSAAAAEQFFPKFCT